MQNKKSNKPEKYLHNISKIKASYPSYQETLNDSGEKDKYLKGKISQGQKFRNSQKKKSKLALNTFLNVRPD